MGYLYLAVAILAEVIATTALNASQGLSRWLPLVITALGYAVAFCCLSLTLRTIPMGIAYAIWAGSGIVLIAVCGALFFKQFPDTPAVLGMLMIVVGVVLLTAISRTGTH